MFKLIKKKKPTPIAKRRYFIPKDDILNFYILMDEERCAKGGGYTEKYNVWLFLSKVFPDIDFSSKKFLINANNILHPYLVEN